ncbi:MAG: hypothetical protein K2I06_10030, partial [Ruminococcus sp.]|nr:hypothetical protein [Ruminococcus sp.]
MGNTNYMDYFKSPEDYIVCMLTSRSKSQNAVPKEVLVSYAYSQGIKVTRSMTKKDIFMALKEKNSLKDIALELSIGVSSNSFQMKFGLSHNEVKRMARLGFIQREFDRKNQSSRPKKPSCILGTEQTE